MKRSVLMLISVCWLIFGFSLFPLYAEEIIWYKFDMPPFHIIRGPFKFQGHLDRRLNFFREKMKDHSHRIRVANIKRIVLDVSENNVVGEALLKTPEREKKMEFSFPHTLSLPHVIMIPKDRAASLTPWLTEDGTVMLEKLVVESNLKLVVSLGRSYTGITDKILKLYRGNKNIVARGTSKGLLEGILRMILLGRGDYTIAYSSETYYFSKLMGKSGTFVSFPIEGMPKYVLGHVVAPKNEWGRNILNEINPIILKYRNSAESRGFTEAWLDENMKIFYRKYMDEAFGPVGNKHSPQ